MKYEVAWQPIDHFESCTRPQATNELPFHIVLLVSNSKEDYEKHTLVPER